MARIFIGSSKESLPLAHQLAEWLQEAGHQPEPWDRVFMPGDITLDALGKRAEAVDGAVFVFGPDDETRFRGETAYQPRGNVLVEFGLFLGRLGKDRAIYCRAGLTRTISDLAGLTYIDVDTSKSPDWGAKRKLETWSNTLTAARWGPGSGAEPGTAPSSCPPERIDLRRSFPLDDFRDALVHAKQVRILQTFIPMVAHLNLFKADLKEAIVRGCEAGILLCNPWSPVCQIRQHSLDGSHATDVKGAIESNLHYFKELFAELPEDARRRLQVRVYSTMPSMAIYQVDDELICGNYFHDMLAIDGPQFRVATPRSRFGEPVRAEHNKIWEHRHTRPVRLHDVDGWLREGPER